MHERSHSQQAYPRYNHPHKHPRSPAKREASPSTPVKNVSTLSDILAKTINRNQPQPHEPQIMRKVGSVSTMNLKHKPRPKCVEKGSTSVDVTEKSLPPKRKITSSILQKITQTLALYPHISHSPSNIRPRFCTQSEDQDSIQPDHLVVNIEKLVLWSQSKLHKTIDKIYEFLLDGKGGHGLRRKPRRFDHPKVSFDRLLKLFLMERYKTEKLCRQNLINMCYSLYYHSNRVTTVSESGPKSKSNHFTHIKYYEIFQNFLNLAYDYEDIVFYLYGYVIMKDIAQSSGPRGLLLLNQAQLKEGLGALTSHDPQLMSFYLHSLVKQPQSYYQVYTVLEFLLNDFKTKKEKIKMKEGCNEEEPLKNEVSPKREKRSLVQYDRAFWVSGRPNKLPVSHELERRLNKQFERQLQKLVELLYEGTVQEHRELVSQLIFNKISCLCYAACLKGNQSWFEELGLSDSPLTNRDILQIELLKRSLAQMQTLARRDQLEGGRVRQFVKKIFTTRRLLGKLQELTESVQSWQASSYY